MSDRSLPFLRASSELGPRTGSKEPTAGPSAAQTGYVRSGLVSWRSGPLESPQAQGWRRQLRANYRTRNGRGGEVGAGQVRPSA